jgi:alkylation response protein AidB-like acyl-CoA dehydrogenase
MASRKDLTAFITAVSAYKNTDPEESFPVGFFKLLREQFLLKTQLSKGYSINREILEILKVIGRKNLSGGRIYEGHLNAIQLIDLYAQQSQKLKWHDDITKQKLFGVWNTEASNGVRIIDQGNDVFELEGSKIFCSGASFVQRPLVTGEWVSHYYKGWQMFILPIENVKPIKCDPDFWHPLGMKGSVSYGMDFTGIKITPADLLGQPGDYYKQPFFGGGAVRFAAVQLGGAEAILEEVHKTLIRLGRNNNTFQQARIAEMAYLIETGNLWLNKAADLANEYSIYGNNSAMNVAYANMTRTVIENTCLKVMQFAERSIGSQAFLQASPLEQLHRDLTTYLRQPAPDAALTDIGVYVFNQGGVLNMWEGTHE